MSAVEREARRDAREFVRAQNFYGEGSRTRRKLIGNSVAYKVENKPGYYRAFEQERRLREQEDHTKIAMRERRRRDAAKAATRNTKALMTGNYQNAQAGVLLVAAVGYFVHQTGLDRRILNKGKEQVRRFRSRFPRKKARVYNITDVR